MKAPMQTSRRADRVDWSQLLYPGPTRRFTADELAQAGDDAPSATLRAIAMVNYALLAFMVLQFAPAQATAPLTGVLAFVGLVTGWVSLRLWRHPSRKALAWHSLLATAGTMAVVVLLANQVAGNPEVRRWVLGLGAGLAASLNTVWWFVTIYRAHQIEGRLREQAEQAQALDMARQLAAAQIQPHFLFNSLASLQHWVQSKDDRAAPMLQALTAYLRATLPLFNRERLALADELEAARQYLTVMQMRLGERLQVGVEVAPEALRAEVPPGLLLTLVENAVEHGVMPSLGPVRVEIAAQLQAQAGAPTQVRLQVHDDGPGLPASPQEGVGLRNTRARLAQAFGPEAQLQLQAGPAGGCLARLNFPLRTPAPLTPPDPRR